MRCNGFALLVAALLSVALTVHAAAEVVYTQVNASIPTGGYYDIDLNHDGVVDFTLRAPFLQSQCQSGDEYVWYLDVNSPNRNAVVTPASQAGFNFASALHANVIVNTAQSFHGSSNVMAELYWGACSAGVEGLWLNLPDRYLGLQFVSPDNTIHYGWVKVSTVAYVDQQRHLHSSTFVSGFAYETVAGQAIRTGQTTD